MNGLRLLKQKQPNGRERLGQGPNRVGQVQLTKGFNKLKAELEERTRINFKILRTGECSRNKK